MKIMMKAAPMNNRDSVVVVGMGEIGRPLYQILATRYRCIGVDLAPVPPSGRCAVLHICYPFQLADFVGTTVGYIDKYKPELTIIHSTIAPGTTACVAETSRSNVAYSPVRGKHRAMRQDMLRYQKFVGSNDPQITEAARVHLERAGFKTAEFLNAELGELAKLIETTWFGMLIGFAQEAERWAVTLGGKYEDVRSFIDEVDFLPHHIFPGFIGGHCVMPNIAILKTRFGSEYLDAVEHSNREKKLEVKSLVASPSNPA